MLHSIVQNPGGVQYQVEVALKDERTQGGTAREGVYLLRDDMLE